MSATHTQIEVQHPGIARDNQRNADLVSPQFTARPDARRILTAVGALGALAATSKSRAILG